MRPLLGLLAAALLLAGCTAPLPPDAASEESRGAAPPRGPPSETWEGELPASAPGVGLSSEPHTFRLPLPALVTFRVEVEGLGVGPITLRVWNDQGTLAAAEGASPLVVDAPAPEGMVTAHVASGLASAGLARSYKATATWG